MSMSEIFPHAVPREVPLTDAILFCGFAESPRIERFSLSRRDMGLLGTLPATTAAPGAASKLLDLINVFSRTRCYKVVVGGRRTKWPMSSNVSWRVGGIHRTRES
jgi:hypothetical protein